MDLTLINGLSRVEQNARTIQGLSRYTPTIAEQEAIGFIKAPNWMLGKEGKRRREERHQAKMEKKASKSELRRSKADAKKLRAEGKLYRGMAKQTKAESGNDDGFLPVEQMTRAISPTEAPAPTETSFFSKPQNIMLVAGLGVGAILLTTQLTKKKKRRK